MSAGQLILGASLWLASIVLVVAFLRGAEARK